MALQTFTAGQVLTAAQVTALQTNGFNQTVSTKTASHVLVAADKGTRVEMNAAGATTITVNTSLFNAGDTLFIQNIGAGVCTITAGTATVSTSGDLALVENAGGTLFFVSAGVAIFYATGVAGSGKILQVISTTKTDTFTMSSSTFADITGLSATITPSATNSKIYVSVTLVSGMNINNTASAFRLLRDSTAIGIGDAAGSRIRTTTAAYAASLIEVVPVAMSFLDSPNTISAVTYKVQIASSVNTFQSTINRSNTDADITNGYRAASTITIMEVAG